MNSEDTVSSWIRRLRDGSESSARKLWHYFLQRLTQLASAKIRESPVRITDADDVVLETFDAVFRALHEGRYPDIDHRDDFWRLLATTAERKAIDRIRAETREKRGGREGVLDEATLIVPGGSSDLGGIDQLACREPTPEFAVMVRDELSQLYELLGEEHLITALQLRLSGYSNEEVGEKLERSRPAVERYFAIIREIYRRGQSDVE